MRDLTESNVTDAVLNTISDDTDPRPEPPPVEPVTSQITDYEAWAHDAIAEISLIESPRGVTDWRKNPAAELQDAEFNAPDAHQRVQEALGWLIELERPQTSD